jgi:hypothetical protein
MFEMPRVAAGPAPDEDYIQPNFGHALRIWWALFWRTTIVAGVLDFGLQLELKRVAEASDSVGPAISFLAQYGNYIISYLVVFFVMYYVLHKSFRGFRIALCENWCTPEAKILEPTLIRSTRIWWTYFWRTAVYEAIGYVVVMLPLTWFVGLFNPSPLVAMLVMWPAGFIVGGAVALFAIYSNILDEDFRSFRVTLVPRATSVPGAEVVAVSTQNEREGRPTQAAS